ncbi:ABC transporter permease subunit [Sedimentibacter sp. zth1]|uniref:ABC transporter permease subunit n=1 Tax=Sedimentibacter sp. zth1 TaxID=2816908 RepID=UPI001A91E66F|nr:ABC transporter permease subunit [Sedimentibacter sp. zth1]QSX04727.1 ABC transporter permease subunit [Sedimentibacter sp. zth1]
MNKQANKNNNLITLIINSLKRMFLGYNTVELSIMEEEQMQSTYMTALKKFLENRVAIISVLVFMSIFIACFVLSAIFPLDVSFQDTTQQNISPGYNIMNLPKELNGKVKSIGVGSTFGVGLDNEGKMYTWGKLDSKLTRLLRESSKSDISYKIVSAGLNHILAVTAEGEVVTWAPDRFNLNIIPLELKNEKNIRQIEAGYQFSVAVTQEGKLYIWGNTNFLGLLNQNTIPEDVQGHVRKVAVNTDNIIVLLKDGTVRVLGTETPSYSNMPKLSRIVDIAATDNAVAALKDNGRVYVWGNPMYEILDIPKKIATDIVKISGGRSHFNAIDARGVVYSWGRKNYNQTHVPANIKNRKSKIEVVYSGYFQNYAVDINGNVTTWGLKGYLMGTDALGRDVFSRLVSGGKVTLTVGAVGVIIQIVLGILIGGLAGYYGGHVDNILMRIAEIVGSIPFLPLAMTLTVVIGNRLSETQRIIMIMFILGILGWSGLARLVRGQILVEKEKEFVLAAKATGIKNRVIIFRHIMPNVLNLVIVNATLSYASCLLMESSLSYLGFGVLDPNPTWGNMLTGVNSSNIIVTYWWRWLFTALALSICTICINVVGEALNESLDPKTKNR